MQSELLKWEEEFSRAIVGNDAGAIGPFLADDWVIVDPDGGIIDKARFLDAVRSGLLTHESMESGDARVRLYGDTAVLTALVRTKGKFMGQEFTSHERATDVFVRRDDRWSCVLSHLTRFTKK